jgi:hypothetical protein
VVTQFDKDDVEKAGLVKFDFLGLRTLTIIDEAVRLVKDVEGVDIDLSHPAAGRCAPPMTLCSRRPTPRRCSSSNPAA